MTKNVKYFAKIQGVTRPYLKLKIDITNRLRQNASKKSILSAGKSYVDHRNKVRAMQEHKMILTINRKINNHEKTHCNDNGL